MNGYSRYAIYAVPQGAFYRVGAEWLGWDSVAGQPCTPPRLPGLPAPAPELSRTPRKYGLHGTIKPPFTLAKGKSAEGLAAALQDFAATQAPVRIPALEVRRLGRFVAIVPEAPCPRLADLAAATVETLDPFRAPITEAELAKRRTTGLSARQDAILQRWGYPYLMAEFRFHITLTGRLTTDSAEATRAALAAHFAPHLPRPYEIADLCLMGEDAAGLFHLIARYPLSGQGQRGRRPPPGVSST